MAKTFIEQFVAQVGWEYDAKSAQKAQKNLNTTVEGIGKSIKRLALSIGSLYAVKAIGNFVVGTNRATAQIDNLGKSVGVSVEFMDALQGALANTGVGAETVLRSISRLNKNMGEFAISGQERMGRSLRALKLDFKDIKDLKPEDQFAKIVDAVQNAPNFQKAMGAASAILGEDAYRLIGYLKTTNMSMGELIQKYKDMDVMTDESHAGAQRFTAAWNDLNFVINAIKGTFAGFLGEALTPLVEEFRMFIVGNRELVRSKLKQWAFGLVKTFKELALIISSAFSAITKIVEAFGGLENVLRIVKFAIAGIALKGTLGFFGKLASGLMGASGGAKALAGAFGVLKAGIAAAAALLIDDFIGNLRGKDSLFGRAIQEAEAWITDLGKAFGKVFGIDLGQMLVSIDKWFSVLDMHIEGLLGKLGFLGELLRGPYNLFKGIFGGGYIADVAKAAFEPTAKAAAKYGYSTNPTSSPFYQAPMSMAPSNVQQPQRVISGVNISVNVDAKPGEDNASLAARIAKETTDRLLKEAQKAVRSGSAGRSK